MESYNLTQNQFCSFQCYTIQERPLTKEYPYITHLPECYSLLPLLLQKCTSPEKSDHPFLFPFHKPTPQEFLTSSEIQLPTSELNLQSTNLLHKHLSSKELHKMITHYPNQSIRQNNYTHTHTGNKEEGLGYKKH